MNNRFNCPNCDKVNGRVNKLNSRMLDLMHTDYRVYDCSCGMKFLWPRVEDGDLEKLYNGDYFGDSSFQATPENYLDTVKSRHVKFTECLEKLRQYLKVSDLRLSHINFLDIGAGTGDMVNLALKAGYNAQGLEFSEYARMKAKENFGIELLDYSISELPEGQFDVIHTNHVFEHFNDPNRELRLINRALKNDGLFYVEIPRQFHIIEIFKYILGLDKIKYNLHSIHHPFFYSESLLCKILIKGSFEILESRTITRINKRWSFKYIFWKLLGMLGIGNIIEVYAVKK